MLLFINSRNLLTFQPLYQFYGSHEQYTDPQISLFNNFFIKNWSHGTIHIFKNYFITVFSVFSFSKISFIQTDPINQWLLLYMLGVYNIIE